MNEIHLFLANFVNYFKYEQIFMDLFFISFINFIKSRLGLVSNKDMKFNLTFWQKFPSAVWMINKYDFKASKLSY